jgi:GxxExxY protein
VIGREPQRHNDTTSERSFREDLVTQTMDCAFDAHRKLGPGLLEKVYERCMVIELGRRNIPFRWQHACPVMYEGVQLDIGFRLDFLIDDHLVLELKAVEKISDVHRAQLLTYLRLSKFPIGLLINFNVALLKDGIRRIVV